MRAHLKALLFVLLITFSSVQLAAAESLSIRADLWPPYNDEPKSIKPGYMIQVMSEIFKPLGYTIDYQPLSWTDSLEAVRKGQFNAVVGATKDDAPDFIFPQEVFGMSDTAFFIKKGTAWKFTSVVPSLKFVSASSRATPTMRNSMPTLTPTRGRNESSRPRVTTPLRTL